MRRWAQAIRGRGKVCSYREEYLDSVMTSFSLFVVFVEKVNNPTLSFPFDSLLADRITLFLYQRVVNWGKFD